MSSDSVTRERIILVASNLFASHGYRQVSARAICARAEANHGAINYYFRNKANLYREVLAYAYHKLMQAQPIPKVANALTVGSQDLLVWIEWYIGRLFSSPETAFAWRLISRELMEPTEAFDYLSQQLMAPVFLSLEQIVAKLLEPVDEEYSGDLESKNTVRLVALSIISQCLIYLMGRPMVERLLPELYGSPESQKVLCHEIYRFSLAGISAYRKSCER